MNGRARIGLAILPGCAVLVVIVALMATPWRETILENVLPCGLGVGLVAGFLAFVLPDGREREEDEEGEPVCTRCVAVVPPFEHYCRRCGTAVGRFTPYLPYEQIPYYCEFFGRLWNTVWLQPGVSLVRRAGCLAVIVWGAPWLLLGLPWVPRKRSGAYRKQHGLCVECGYKLSVPAESHCAGCGAAYARCGCGYDLTGNESGACPECGEAVEAEGDGA